MRTTLNIEDDILIAAKELAGREKKSVGQALSVLARRGLTELAPSSIRRANAYFGFRPFPEEGRLVSNELINKLRENGEY